MDKKNRPDLLEELLEKYLAGTCNDEERKAVEAWYNQYDQIDDSKAQMDLISENALFNRLQTSIQDENDQAPVLNIKPKRVWLVAAAFIGIAIAGSLIYFNSGQKQAPQAIASKANRFQNDIQPGKAGAVLMLADGSSVNLQEGTDGKIAKQGVVDVLKADNTLNYSAAARPAGELLFNTLTTPRGSKFNLVLPDGSRVWLNAGSSIRFPVSFNGPDRKVELQGEAYFEIAKDARHPFTVATTRASVQVLGTHFNVSAYSEELLKTTLLEGSVNFIVGNQTKKLIPGKQAVLDANNQTQIQSADIEETMAWKNDLFWFKDASINTVMRQLARWYDVEIVYKGNVSSHFTGSIPRNLSAIKTLTILEMTGGVHFGIEGKKIIVEP